MKPIAVMINGLPGNVASIVARHILEDDRLRLLPWSLTGPEIAEKRVDIKGYSIGLVRPEVRTDFISKGNRPDISVDFTHPTVVNDNAVWYCEHEFPFVMGTTGGDRKKLEETVCASAIPAVIAPNMAKQIVGFQAMMSYAADQFPGLFKDHSLQIRESHQKGKADTSGTAKAMVACFNRLGIPFAEDQIQMERDPQSQEKVWGIPKASLSGHAWHTYTIISQDKTVKFEFTHNVNGREIYALGTLDAIVFLQRKVLSGAKGRVYSMIDVLKGT